MTVGFFGFVDEFSGAGAPFFLGVAVSGHKSE